MKKKYYILYIITLLTLNITAQDYSTLWEGHYSFFNIQDVSQGNNKVYAASENAIFIYNTINQELQELTTVEGLSGEYISTIHYSEIYELLLIGYENGLIEVYKEQDGEIITVVDIVNKQNIPPDSKRINHFNEYNDIVYIATDYGISVYSLERLEFGDTYFIGDLGSQINITQTTVQGDLIYASSSENGIKSALVADENIIDYQQWATVIEGGYKGVQSLGVELYAVNNSNAILKFDSDVGFLQIDTFLSPVVDFRAFSGVLTITTKSSIHSFSEGYVLINEVTSLFDYDYLLQTGYAFNNSFYLL